ncbi:hypothetical protein PIROE2DRAFT_57187 [Piromyces sp. E2]|nr:hypothetical protein PIROE2DRAFT_57187 [Piromyces sp. E2]|eukprot:OUM69953.1 hypothetical protein PIROE2DRAFT_57187 [Piromyces sp. E2]
MPIHITKEFRDSIMDSTSFGFNYYPSITKDILKMNSVMINKQFKSDDSPNNSDTLLFDPNEVFNIISNNTNEELPISKEETKTVSPLGSFSYDDNENEDTGTIKYKKIPTSETSNSIKSNNSENYCLNNDANVSTLNLSLLSNKVIEEANTLLSLSNVEGNSRLFDAMLNSLEIAMENEMNQIHSFFQNKKDPIITEIQRRHK